MKTIGAAFLVAGGLLLAHAAFAQQHHVELRGIINLAGRQQALLEIDQSSWWMNAGQHMAARNRGKTVSIEVLDIDFTNQIVSTRVDGEDFTNTPPASIHPATDRNWIDFQTPDFDNTPELLGLLSGRTILLHPDVHATRALSNPIWTSPATDKQQAAASVIKELNQNGISALEDGDSFLQLVPTKTAQSAALGAKDLLHPGSEMIQSGAISFTGVDISEVLNIYGKLINRPLKGPLPADRRTIKFVTTCPLSKEQVIYAFETLFRWNGVQIVTNDDNTFSALVTAQQSK